MFSKINDAIYNTMTDVYFTVEDFKHDPKAMIQKLERGDADSSGSTLRTIGIVVLVLSVVMIIGAAVILASRDAASKIGAASFDTLDQR
jgi:hypothetical protein